MPFPAATSAHDLWVGFRGASLQGVTCDFGLLSCALSECDGNECLLVYFFKLWDNFRRREGVCWG